MKPNPTLFYWYLRTQIKLLAERGVYKSYSQFGEDMVVRSLLKSGQGFYVDVGAADPVLYSNTYHFYRKGWRGIAIDPNPTLSKRYKLFRPRDKFVTAGVGRGAALAYHVFNDETYNTFSKKDAEIYLKRSSVKLISKMLIETHPLSELLKGEERIDFLNIDVQGLDLEVLKTHNWNIRPRVIAVEDETFSSEKVNESEVYKFLRSKGYALKGLCGLTMIWS